MKPRREIRKEAKFWLVCFVSSATTLAVDAAKKSSTLLEDERMKQERLQAKPWYLRDTNLFGITTLPVSPVTIVVLVISFFTLFRGLLEPKSWAEASHILIEKHDDATKKQLEKMKKDIGNDPVKFAKVAHEESACPSKHNGGNLGRFNAGDMAPTFDEAVFNPANPIGVTVGPVQTPFGWHLIMIHKRQLARQ